MKRARVGVYLKITASGSKGESCRKEVKNNLLYRAGGNEGARGSWGPKVFQIQDSGGKGIYNRLT